LKPRGDVTDDKLHFVPASDDGGEGRDNHRQQGEPADPTRANAALLSAMTSHFTRLHLRGVLGYTGGGLCLTHGVNDLRSIADAGRMRSPMRTNPISTWVITLRVFPPANSESEIGGQAHRLAPAPSRQPERSPYKPLFRIIAPNRPAEIPLDGDAQKSLCPI
jgi:hypothetical protein